MIPEENLFNPISVHNLKLPINIGLFVQNIATGNSVDHLTGVFSFVPCAKMADD